MDYRERYFAKEGLATEPEHRGTVFACAPENRQLSKLSVRFSHDIDGLILQVF
jgi:hypothetical protein